MNNNYKISSKKRYIKRNKDRKNKLNNLLLPKFNVLQYNNEYKIFEYKKLDELNKYKVLYPKHMWYECSTFNVNRRYNQFMFYNVIDNHNYDYNNNYSCIYICDFCCFDYFDDDDDYEHYKQRNYDYNLQFIDVDGITIHNNIINKFKKVINNYIKHKLNKIITDKLNDIYFINKIFNKINDSIIISNPLYKKKSIIFYDIESITKYLLNNIINYKLKIKLFKSISLKNNISIYRENKIKNYIKFQYLLCIILIMRQKYNFQDYDFF